MALPTHEDTDHLTRRDRDNAVSPAAKATKVTTALSPFGIDANECNSGGHDPLLDCSGVREGDRARYWRPRVRSGWI